jgi:hypothetical protein
MVTLRRLTSITASRLTPASGEDVTYRTLVIHESPSTISDFLRGVVLGLSIAFSKAQGHLSVCNQTLIAFTGVSPSETSATFPDLSSFESSKSNSSATPFLSIHLA